MCSPGYVSILTWSNTFLSSSIPQQKDYDGYSRQRPCSHTRDSGSFTGPIQEFRSLCKIINPSSDVSGRDENKYCILKISLYYSYSLLSVWQCRCCICICITNVKILDTWFGFTTEFIWLLKTVTTILIIELSLIYTNNNLLRINVRVIRRYP
jgi:hypothetical protein